MGELAKETGLSVRALHHYDEIGLLWPSRRTEAGHRLYEPSDVLRLQQVRSLKHLGFGLGRSGSGWTGWTIPYVRLSNCASRVGEWIEL